MCVVSMITDHYKYKWPIPEQIPQAELPNIKELIEKARKYDELMAQPDCPSDDKAKWLEEFEKQLVKKYNLKKKGTK